jgi:hypothetical protein
MAPSRPLTSIKRQKQSTSGTASGLVAFDLSVVIGLLQALAVDLVHCVLQKHERKGVMT